MRISVRWRQPTRPRFTVTRRSENAPSTLRHARLHCITLQQPSRPGQERTPCSQTAHPAVRTTSQCTAAAGESTPHSLSGRTPSPPIRTGSLAPHDGRREILALLGTRTLVRNSATYTEICALRRSTRRHRPRFHAAQSPSYPSPSLPSTSQSHLNRLIHSTVRLLIVDVAGRERERLRPTRLRPSILGTRPFGW